MLRIFTVETYMRKKSYKCVEGM